MGADVGDVPGDGDAAPDDPAGRRGGRGHGKVRRYHRHRDRQRVVPFVELAPVLAAVGYEYEVAAPQGRRGNVVGRSEGILLARVDHSLPEEAGAAHEGVL